MMAFAVALVFLCYYVIAYPVIHAGLRYRGHNKSAWLGWLAAESVGLGFPLVRIAYFFMHILPDIRATGDYRWPRQPLSEEKSPHQTALNPSA